MNPVERLLAGLFVRPGDTVFDIGAHEGESAALYLARGAGSVLSFEPRAAPRGRFPAAIRDDPRLTLYPFGLSDRVGSAEIYVPSDRDGASTLDRSFLRCFRGEDGVAELVELQRIDDMELPHAQFWKIDAEGSEMEILRGAEKTLTTSPPDVLQVEIFLRDWSRYAATLNFLLLRFAHVWAVGVTETGRVVAHPVTPQMAKDPAIHGSLRRTGTPRYCASAKPFESWVSPHVVR